jgi:hypothetical protein
MERESKKERNPRSVVPFSFGLLSGLNGTFERTPKLRQVIHNLGTTSKSFITGELETVSASNPNKIKENTEKSST